MGDVFALRVKNRQIGIPMKLCYTSGFHFLILQNVHITALRYTDEGVATVLPTEASFGATLERLWVIGLMSILVSFVTRVVGEAFYQSLPRPELSINFSYHFHKWYSPYC